MGASAHEPGLPSSVDSARAATRRTQRTAAVLLPSADGTLWVGQIYRGRLLELRLEPERPETGEPTTGRPAMPTSPPHPRSGPPRLAVNTARRLLDAVAEGPDGVLSTCW